MAEVTRTRTVTSPVGPGVHEVMGAPLRRAATAACAQGSAPPSATCWAAASAARSAAVAAVAAMTWADPTSPAASTSDSATATTASTSTAPDPASRTGPGAREPGR
nr:hypothetical protein [Cellulomonas dongxiuzhuiae]